MQREGVVEGKWLKGRGRKDQWRSTKCEHCHGIDWGLYLEERMRC
jgi:hypothetical protein